MRKTCTMIFGEKGIGIRVDPDEARKLRRNGEVTSTSSTVPGAYFWTDEFGNEYATYPIRP